jgi:KDO2-lipid IV(A) lauroyltransferase
LARVEAALLNGGLAGLSRLPYRARERLLGAFARVGCAVDRSHAEAAREWIDLALGPDLPDAELDARVRQAFRHLFRVTLDTHAVMRRIAPERLLEHVDVHKSADVDELLRSKRGALFASAHVGDWETGAAILPWIGFDPLYVVSRPIQNRYLALTAQRERERRGVRILPRKGALRDIPAVLAAGGHVAMLLDQRARHRPLTAPFFGQPAACERAPAVLARRARCPILFGSCTYASEPLRWRLELGPVLWPEQTRRLDPVGLATRINQELERLIRAAPEQHLWLHERYRVRKPKARELVRAGTTAEPLDPEEDDEG